DEQVIGFPVSVFVSVKLDKQVDEALRNFESSTLRCPEVVDCWLMTGTRDYLLRVATADLKEFEVFLTSNLTKIAGQA
ncbi:Lrp/AsnC family transcriptional regulator, partial [Rhodobacteraceae bacterium R_SAG10]|nr:Lrp/AsnC family transcriptional regulator [Rhodobacteraceae bacterium R_SAG10]